MSKIEEVKKILRKFRDRIETEHYDFHYDAQLEAESKLYQLFEPNPDEDRLLTPKEIDAVFAQWSEETQGSVSNELGNTYSQAIAKSQLAKDMEWEDKFGFIKEAEFKEKCANCDTPLTVEGKIQKAVDKVNTECQERIERISKEIDLISNKIAECVSNIRGDWSEPRPDCKEIEQELRKLEALKKQEGIK